MTQEFIDFFWSLGEPINLLVILTFALAVIAAFSVNRALNVLKAKLGIEPTPRKGWFGKSAHKVIWDDVDIENEKDVLLDHDYDGIHELDNTLPPWWLWGFYFTIFWGLVYVIYFHIATDDKLQADEFAASMQARQELRDAALANAADQVDENTVVLLTGDADMAAGKEIYDLNCAACHLVDGGGSIGPNFTDNYWIHGNTINDVYGVVKYGVLDKGMIPWEEQLSPLQMQQVSSYILSMVGTTPATAKEPQGRLYEEVVADADAEAPVEESTETEVTE